MEQATIRRLKPGTLDDYRQVAKEKGRSLEAELRELIETHRPMRRKDPARLLALSAAARARTIVVPEPSDSTLLIREDRDTNFGKWKREPADDDRR